MSLKETLKTESRKEREKMKKMSKNDLVWYIWEYYKLHMLAALGVLLVIYLIINMIYHSTFDTRLSYVVINNASTESLDLEPFNTKFKEYMNYGKKDLISSETSLVMQHGQRTSELEYASMAKVSALVASQDLDLMITDQLNIDHYMGLDAFFNLEEFLPDDLWQLAKDFVYYAADSEGRQIPCAVSLNSTAFPAETGASITPCYVGVISGSGRTDTAISWLRFVLEGQ